MIRKLAAYAMRLAAEQLDPEPVHTVYVYGDPYSDDSPRERHAYFKRMAERAKDN